MNLDQVMFPSKCSDRLVRLPRITSKWNWHLHTWTPLGGHLFSNQPVIKVPKVLSVHNTSNETPINQSPLWSNYSQLLVILMRVFLFSLPLFDGPPIFYTVSLFNLVLEKRSRERLMIDKKTFKICLYYDCLNIIPFSQRNNKILKNIQRTPTPTKWLGKWPTSHFREWPFIRGSPVFCTKLTESVCFSSIQWIHDRSPLTQSVHHRSRTRRAQITKRYSNVSNADRSRQAQSPNG